MTWDKNVSKYAEEQGNYAKNQGDYAKGEADNLLVLKANTVNASNTATTQAEYASTQGDYAKSQGESIEIQETERQENEDQRILNENNRDSAEDSRNLNEASRIYDEDVRQNQESDRITSENQRGSNETTREANESTRKANETSREDAESIRVTSEDSRVSAESSRQNSESIRQSQESTRVSQEQTRQSQESTRQTNTTDAIDNLNAEVTNLKLNYLVPVLTFADIATTYTSPAIGDIVQVEDTMKFYRWNGTEWKYNQTYSSNAVTANTNEINILSGESGVVEKLNKADYDYQMSLQDQQTQTLTHGLQIIESDQASNLGVSFSGNTLVNSLGRKGKGDSLSGYVNSGLSINAERFYSDGVGTDYAYIDLTVKENAYYLAKINIEKLGASVPTNVFRANYGENTYSASYFGKTGEGEMYAKFQATYGTTLRIFPLYSVDVEVASSHLSLIEISQETSDKIGDLSLTGDDVAYVEREFPYVDGIKGVKHPVIRVESGQLFNIHDVDLHANAELTDSRTITLNATASSQTSVFTFNGTPNTTYTITGETNSDRLRIHLYDKNGSNTNVYDIATTGEQTFTTGSNFDYLTVSLYSTISGTFTFSDIMLNLGSTSLPYTDYNSDYLYAETTLYGNDVKKDILLANSSTGQWEVIRNFKTGVVL